MGTHDEPLRHETVTEGLDRNWMELLQELRVILTGVQLLTGFLLTLPFQQRFTTLTHGERIAYLVTAALAVAATALLQAPVIVHRALFRRHRRRETVTAAHRMAIVGMALLGLAIIGVAFLIAGVLLGQLAGLVSAAGAAVLIGLLWVALPLVARSRSVAVD